MQKVCVLDELQMNFFHLLPVPCSCLSHVVKLQRKIELITVVTRWCLDSGREPAHVSVHRVRFIQKRSSVARIKLAYIGGGSTRAPGTMASLIHQGQNFQGSEVVLIDIDGSHLPLVKTLADKMARNYGIDLRVSYTTDRRAGLQDCDAVLTSFRPGGFEARYLDEAIPLKHGVIGQETQGPGGFFMALRSIHVMQGIVADMEAVCPGAILFNYTNPINIVSQALTQHTGIPTVSLCEGPIIFPRGIARAADLDPDKVDAIMIGLNHGSWSVRHQYDGQDIMPRLEAAYERLRDQPD